MLGAFSLQRHYQMLKPWRQIGSALMRRKQAVLAERTAWRVPLQALLAS